MTEHEDQPLDSGTSRRGADLAKELDELLTDSPGTEPTPQRVEDHEEAHAMGIAGDEKRSAASKERAEASKDVTESEAPNAFSGRFYKDRIDQHLRNAESDEAQAEVLENWAQGLHAHPELTGKALDGEELTPERLVRLEEELGDEEYDIQHLEKLAEKIISSSYSERWKFDAQRYGAWRSTERGEDSMMVPDLKELFEELDKLKSNDETSVGELKKLQASYLQKAAQKYHEHFDPRKALLDKIRG